MRTAQAGVGVQVAAALWLPPRRRRPDEASPSGRDATTTTCPGRYIPAPAMPERPMSGLPDEPLGDVDSDGAELPDEPLGNEPVPSLLGAGAGCDGLPIDEPVLVSPADEPVLPGTVLAPLGALPVLGAAVPPPGACATSTPPSGGA